MEMKTAAIIQARSGSTRLPGKVLLEVMGKTILEYVIERVGRAKRVDEVIIATTDKKEDSGIADIARAAGAMVFRGSEDDVLDRFYQAARSFGVTHVVRITSDCPLIDPALVDEAVGRYFDSGVDYCTNTMTDTYPDGEDVEVFSFEALEKAWFEASLLSEREHVTPYIRNNPGKFRIMNFENGEDLSAKRWTLDEQKDLYLIRTVIESLYPSRPGFTIGDILDLLKERPEIENVNSDIKRNEGYQKSLRSDRRAGPRGEGG